MPYAGVVVFSQRGARVGVPFNYDRVMKTGVGSAEGQTASTRE
jgi:hypothetical protein